MDWNQRIARLATAEQCEIFEKNATRQNRRDLAVAARKRKLELLAADYCKKYANQAERECIEAVFAYEEGLSARAGAKRYASRTWPMFKEHGILGTVERLVCRQDDPIGFTVLRELGLEDFAFEAVVVRYPELFSVDALRRSKERLASWAQAHDPYAQCEQR